MGHFFFHFHDGFALSTDTEGLEFSDSERAYLEAAAAARAMWADLLENRIDPNGCAFEICDEQGSLLFRFRFSELVEGCRKAVPETVKQCELHRELKHTMERAHGAAAHLQRGLKEARHGLKEATKILEQLHFVR